MKKKGPLKTTIDNGCFLGWPFIIGDEMKKQRILSLHLFLVLFVLAGCFSGAEPTPEPPTEVPVQENTPVPPPTAIPTEVVEPTDEPTATAVPETEEAETEPEAETETEAEEVEPGFATNPSGTFVITIRDDGSRLYEVFDSGFSIEFSEDYQAVDPADNEAIQAALEDALSGNFFDGQAMAQFAASGIKLYAVNLSTESLTATNPGSINVIRQELPIELTLEQLVTINDTQLGDILDLTSDITISETKLGDDPAAIFEYKANIPNAVGQMVEQSNRQYFVMDPDDPMVAYIITAAVSAESVDAVGTSLYEAAETFRLLDN